MSQVSVVSELESLVKLVEKSADRKGWAVVLVPRADEYHSKIEVHARNSKTNQHWDHEIAFEPPSFGRVKEELGLTERYLRDLGLRFERRAWIGAREYGSEARGQIAALAMFVSLVLFVTLWCVFVDLHRLFPSQAPGNVDDHTLVRFVIYFGVLGSLLRGVGEFFNDVGNRRFDPAWSLSYLMRPFEGAGMALVIFLAVRGGVGFLSEGEAPHNALGYLFIAALAGMFSHRAVDGLRKRFDQFFSS